MRALNERSTTYTLPELCNKKVKDKAYKKEG